MSLLSRMSSLWRNVVHRGDVDRELEEEVRTIFELLVAEKIRNGMRPDEARRAATLELGRVETITEHVRDVRAGAFVETVLKDIRYGLRLFRRNPLFTLTAALSLAIGIGINSALFSLHDAILLRALPIREPGAVVTVNAASPDEPGFQGRVSYPNYRDLRQGARSFDGLIAHRLSMFSFGRSREAVRDMRLGMMVSDNFFDVIGVEPAFGRRFAPGEGTVPDRDAVVVLGYDFWKNSLAEDRSILNATVLINGIDFTVIGVTPATFTGMDQFVRPAFYVPLMMAGRLAPAAQNPLEDRAARSWMVKGRLKPAVSQQDANAELTMLWKRLQEQHPEENRNRAIAVFSELQERIRATPANAIIGALMTVLAAIVLVIACANVANLLLGRARARSREIAVRIALGVGRMRLLRQMLTESLMLALLGGVLGLAFAYGGIRFLSSLVEAAVPTNIPVVVDPQMDHRVLLFSLLAAVVSAVLFGMAPARQSLKTELVPALKSSELGQPTRHKTLGSNLLVIGQVALSMVLLVAAGMLQAGFRKTLNLDPGFRTNHLIVLSLDTALLRYTPQQTHDFYRNLVDRARALPGAVSATLTSAIPLDRGFSSRESVAPEGYQFPRGQDSVLLFAAVVDEHYFPTIGTEIVRGRAFTADDKEGSRRVGIVNEEFAKTYWPNQEPIGKRIRLDKRDITLEVVGLARTEKYSRITEAPTPFLYLPFAQDQRTGMSLLVQTTNADASPLAEPLRQLVRSLDASQPVSNLRTFSSFYNQEAIAAPLMVTKVATLMGLLGLTLALVGLYGVVAYSVARRTREIGIRMAIGAARSDVLMMVMRQGLLLASAGVLLGAVISLAVARLLAAGTAGLGAPNIATYVIVPVMLIGLTMAASYLPARRASQVDPLRALRYE